MVLMYVARFAAATLFMFAFPLAVVLTMVLSITFDQGYYMRGYAKNEVTQTTGMSVAELSEATRQVQAFFRGGPPVSLIVRKEWGREILFNSREQQHLVDVRGLFDLVGLGQILSIVYMIIAAIVVLLIGRSRGARTLARWVTAGSALMLGIFALVGVLALGDFQALWTQFHLVSFSNDLWLLDWRTDYMIRLWPLGFWFGAVTDVVIRSAVAAILALVIAQIYLRRTPRRASVPALATT